MISLLIWHLSEVNELSCSFLSSASEYLNFIGVQMDLAKSGESYQKVFLLSISQRQVLLPSKIWSFLDLSESLRITVHSVQNGSSVSNCVRGVSHGAKSAKFVLGTGRARDLALRLSLCHYIATNISQ